MVAFGNKQESMLVLSNHCESNGSYSLFKKLKLIYHRKWLHFSDYCKAGGLGGLQLTPLFIVHFMSYVVFVVGAIQDSIGPKCLYSPFPVLHYPNAWNAKMLSASYKKRRKLSFTAWWGGGGGGLGRSNFIFTLPPPPTFYFALPPLYCNLAPNECQYDCLQIFRLVE